MERPTLIVQLRRTHREPEETLRFARSPVRIGRGPRNELMIDHAFVSHQHAVLHFDESGIDFVDLGSTNGSFLEGALVTAHQFASVHMGAEIGVGIARMTVRLDLHGERRAPLAGPSADGSNSAALEGGVQAHALASVLDRFAASFLALSKEQRAWRERVGLEAARSGLHALRDPVALMTYLLTPGHEASRIEELEVACEELLSNERALVRALADEPSLEAP